MTRHKDKNIKKHPKKTTRSPRRFPSAAGVSSSDHDRGNDQRKKGPGRPYRLHGRSYDSKSSYTKVPRLFPSKEKRELAVCRSQEQLKEWHKQSARTGQHITETHHLDRLDLLDTWQADAFEALMKGSHVVVDAPTTAGKTRIVETFLFSKLATNSTLQPFRACYTCPVKSLANDKLMEMRSLFGEDKVGINTGDIKHNLDAPLIVATLESYRNSLLGLDIRLPIHLVIFDEYHYIQDFARGSSWEEAIILSDPASQLLLLSASVANSDDFATWIQGIHNHPTVHIRTEKRPVPLKNMIFDGDHWFLEKYVPHFSKNPHSTPEDIIPYSILVKSLAQAEAEALTPCLVYTGKRLSCERLAKVFARRLKPLDPLKSRKLSEDFDHALSTYKATELCSHAYRKMLVHAGVAYHHSGLPPPLRISVEALIKQGQLRICVATSGLSLGINFAVRSALIADGKRPGDQGVMEYPPSDILQMLGRAGRRGSDMVGYSLWPTHKHYQAFGGAEREGITPRLKYDPSTFLGLLEKGLSLTTIETLYRKSFQYYFAKEHRVKLISGSRLTKFLAPKTSLPCKDVSAMYVFHKWQSEKGGMCGGCSHRELCHPFITSSLDDHLSKLHYHLHSIGAINDQEALTSYGGIAKYFPHPGGLYIAKLLTSGFKQTRSITDLAEIMASFSLAFYKSIDSATHYSLPVNEKNYRRSLAKLYPTELFSHLYDMPFRGKKVLSLIDCNPEAGYLIKRWIMNDSWEELIHEVCHRYFASGDVFSLIYKTANYLQSLAQSKLPMSKEARDLRAHLLRPPLDYIMPPGENNQKVKS
ncbi:MAG: DEAD/DEAH box helicase [Proteobacteria bacterium]|nr:DEAD/DEAH box helicase [Pseudomonadota bacterium]